MRQLKLIPALVIIILLGAAGIYYLAVQRQVKQVQTPPVVLDSAGTPPAVSSGSAPTPPAIAPMPDTPPPTETPEAEQSTSIADAGPPPALPTDIQNLPASTAANSLLSSLPSTPPDANGKPAPVAVGPLKIGAPIANLHPRDIQDTYNQGRDHGRTHEATDILAPRNTPILAVADGTIEKLFLSKPGGITVYQFDPTRTYCYYYAHLDRYAKGLKEGQAVKKGDLVGYVGTTGNASAKQPHLHFAIFQLLIDKKWWHGKPINPYNSLLKAIAVQ